ncbi:hypothetical protein B0T44_06340 [Nocardia donostiensis]|uniref:Uncharacterized protein n=2 Tax=Nocardia donostiensis TaxID=1538463 RepID=A0A1V2TK02_9NOCA|nr:hypothetical protein B0T46_05190 [Nocardia donostiensis]OQS22242.1 hypothetical protein B0T44_06340 [Nocardia donostiensis]
MPQGPLRFRAYLYAVRMDTSACEHHSFPEFGPLSNATWGGFLAENWATGAAELTWSIFFGGWPDEDSGVGFHIEAIPFTVPSWRELEGAYAECSEFGEPIEAYLFDDEHSNFEYVRIQALHQVGATVRFAIDLAECEVDRVKVDPDEHTWADIDPMRVVVDAEFEGVTVRTPEHRLADFIDTTGLVFDASCNIYRLPGD